MTHDAFDPRGFPGYLFDLDGTLIDTAPDIGAAVNHALNRFGFDSVSGDLVRHWVGHGGKHCIEHAVAAAQENAIGNPRTNATDGMGDGHGREGSAQPLDSAHSGVDSALVDAMLGLFLEHYEEHIADMSLPYPQVVETLRALSRCNAKLAVVTNKRIGLTRKLLDELQLTAWFDTIVGGDTAANPKPAADPILYACDQIGLSPQDVLFVGDSLTDVNASRAAGCPVVCVPDGYNHGIAPGDLGADAIIGSFRELV